MINTSEVLSTEFWESLHVDSERGDIRTGNGTGSESSVPLDPRYAQSVFINLREVSESGRIVETRPLKLGNFLVRYLIEGRGDNAEGGRRTFDMYRVLTLEDGREIEGVLSQRSAVSNGGIKIIRNDNNKSVGFSYYTVNLLSRVAVSLSRNNYLGLLLAMGHGGLRDLNVLKGLKNPAFMSFVFGEEGLSYGPRALAIGADNLLQEMDKSGYAAIDKANEIIDQGLKEGREAKQIDLRQLEAGMKLYRDRHLEGEKPRYHVPTRSAMTLARSVQAPMSVSRVFARR